MPVEESQDPKLKSEEVTIGQLAVQLKYITAAQLDTVIDVQRQEIEAGQKPRRFGEICVALGFLRDKEIEQLLRVQIKKSKAQLIKGYQILGKLGQGAMGAVYKAVSLKTGLTVALKLLATHLAANEKLVKRFHREAAICCRIRHPNIVEGYEVGEYGGTHFLVMEYVHGVTVKDRLKDLGRIPEGEARKIVAQTCRALAGAVKEHLIHRDIKPDNLMVMPDGHVKLLDLGLAKQSGQDATLTMAGATMGTPYYLAPEQARGADTVDIRGDLYSLGATFYHMVTGEVPYSGRNAVEVVQKHLYDPIPDPREKAPGLSERAAAVIRRAMQKSAGDRYQSPDEMLTDLTGGVSSGVHVLDDSAELLTPEEAARMLGANFTREQPQALLAREAARMMQAPGQRTGLADGPPMMAGNEPGGLRDAQRPSLEELEDLDEEIVAEIDDERDEAPDFAPATPASRRPLSDQPRGARAKGEHAPKPQPRARALRSRERPARRASERSPSSAGSLTQAWAEARQEWRSFRAKFTAWLKNAARKPRAAAKRSEKPWNRQTLEQDCASPNPLDREWAAYLLADLGDKGGGAALLPLLDDPDAEVRLWTIYALGKLGDFAAVPRLVHRLADEDVFLRSVAHEALKLIAKRDLGRNAQRWLEWYARQKKLPN